MPFSCEPFGFVDNTGLLHGPFLFQPVETELFPHREGRTPPYAAPLKNPGNTTLTWFLKLLNRISALPPNLALGMKTHRAAAVEAVRHEFRWISLTASSLSQVSSLQSRRHWKVRPSLRAEEALLRKACLLEATAFRFADTLRQAGGISRAVPGKWHSPYL